VGRAGAAVSERATYRYRAARRDGALELGTIEAPSREAASALLSARQLFPIELRLDSAAEGRRGRIPVPDLALALRVFATLLESGLPISRALLALDDLAPISWHAALPAIRESVRDGKSLAAAFSAAPVEFPSLVIGIVQAGEAGSGIAPAVRRAAELMESAAATRTAVRGALAYPLVLAGAGTASVALLVGVVLPRFATILADLGQSLPPTTRLVLGSAAVLRATALPGLLLAAAVLVAWRGWTASEHGRLRWHEFLLSLPLIGSIRRSGATARGAAALAALLMSGVPLAPGLLHSARAAGDAAMARRLLAAREAIIGGSGIARALQVENAATPTTVRLVRAGEQTGQLAGMLTHAARLESERVEQTVRSAVRLLEPVLILAFGGIVALVAAALLQAVYSVRPTP
jgi:general secretion pathway protein F